MPADANWHLELLSLHESFECVARELVFVVCFGCGFGFNFGRSFSLCFGAND